MDETGLGTKLAAQLQQEGKSVIMVTPGSGFSRESDSQFVINPGESNHYKTLVEELRGLNRIPGCIIHLWGLSKPDSAEIAADNNKNCECCNVNTELVKYTFIEISE